VSVPEEFSLIKTKRIYTLIEIIEEFDFGIVAHYAASPSGGDRRNAMVFFRREEGVGGRLSVDTSRVFLISNQYYDWQSGPSMGDLEDIVRQALSIDDTIADLPFVRVSSSWKDINVIREDKEDEPLCIREIDPPSVIKSALKAWVVEDIVVYLLMDIENDMSKHWYYAIPEEGIGGRMVAPEFENWDDFEIHTRWYGRVHGFDSNNSTSLLRWLREIYDFYLYRRRKGLFF
jgi:hypothetical protein